MAGPFTYPVSEALPFDGSLAVPPFVAENAKDGIIEARDTAPGTSSRYAAVSGKFGNIKNAWLEFFDSNPSNTIPFVVAEAGEIKALSIAVQTSVTNGVVKVYKNAVLIHTVTFTGLTFFVNGLTYSCVAGDKISVEVGNVSLKNPIFTTFVKVLGA